MFTREELSVAGASAGDGSADTPELRAVVDTITYEPDTAAAYDVGATLAVAVVRPPGFDPEEILSGVSLDAAFTLRPRVPAQDAAGADIAGTALGVAIAMEALRFIVTNGGDGNTGKFLLTFRRQ